MECPEHNVEMREVDNTTNAYDGTSVFWICDGEGRFPRKHIVMTEEWAGSITFYWVDWKLLKEGLDSNES